MSNHALMPQLRQTLGTCGRGLAACNMMRGIANKREFWLMMTVLIGRQPCTQSTADEYNTCYCALYIYSPALRLVSCVVLTCTIIAQNTTFIITRMCSGIFQAC